MSCLLGAAPDSGLSKLLSVVGSSVSCEVGACAISAYLTPGFLVNASVGWYAAPADAGAFEVMVRVCLSPVDMSVALAETGSDEYDWSTGHASGSLYASNTVPPIVSVGLEVTVEMSVWVLSMIPDC